MARLDASNSRVNVYAADGSYETMWRLTTRMFGTQNALTSDTAGNTWMMLWLDAADRPPYSQARARFDASGAVLDTVFIPEPPGRDSGLVARSEGSQVRYALPYGRNSVSAVSGRGGILWALNTPYVVYSQHGTRVLRIEKEWQPIAIPEPERASARRNTEASLKAFLPTYSWNGPDIPTEMPPIRSIYAGTDARIWVEIAAPFERYVEPPSPRDSAGAPTEAYRAREKLWDVFSRDGAYLGRVRAPRTVRLFATRGNYVWGNIRDDDDVPTLVKYRVTPPW